MLSVAVPPMHEPWDASNFSYFKSFGSLEQRLTYMDGLTSVLADNLKANDIFHAAQARKRFQNMVANVRI